MDATRRTKLSGKVTESRWHKMQLAFLLHFGKINFSLNLVADMDYEFTPANDNELIKIHYRLDTRIV